jgi:hypothetical protein
MKLCIPSHILYLAVTTPRSIEFNEKKRVGLRLLIYVHELSVEHIVYDCMKSTYTRYDNDTSYKIRHDKIDTKRVEAYTDIMACNAGKLCGSSYAKNDQNLPKLSSSRIRTPAASASSGVDARARESTTNKAVRTRRWFIACKICSCSRSYGT